MGASSNSCEGLPFLQEHFPELVDRTAAGLFRGSQVLGAEDVLSRDHGRGPMFLLLLIQQDYAAQGQVLKQAMVGAAPQEWLGYRYCGGLTTNIEVSNPGPILPSAGLAGSLVRPAPLPRGDLIKGKKAPFPPNPGGRGDGALGVSLADLGPKMNLQGSRGKAAKTLQPQTRQDRGK